MDRFDEWAKELLPCLCPDAELRQSVFHSPNCPYKLRPAIAAALRSASHRQETEGETEQLAEAVAWHVGAAALAVLEDHGCGILANHLANLRDALRARGKGGSRAD